MTDITDQDRRHARQWADEISEYPTLNENARAAVKYVLATVDAPAPTLAEELRCLTRRLERNTDPDKLLAAAFFSAAARAEQMERDLAEARAEAERLTAKNENLRRTDNYREFKEFLGVQKGAESNAESIDPADVKPGEAWIVECRGERRTAVKGRADDLPWSTIDANGRHFYKRNKNVTLVSRLVPAPRVITNPDDLDRLAEGAAIFSLSTKYAVQRRDAEGVWYCPATRGKATSTEVLSCGPVTVLWEPGA